MRKEYIQPLSICQLVTPQHALAVSIINDPSSDLQGDAPRRKYIGHLIYS